MAIMIPEKPRHFEPASQEGLIFSALEKLSDDYYVFHSFRITTVKSGILHESETDFVIFNRKRGIICLEAKAGQVRYSQGEWRYGDNRPMHNGGPFNQADANKWKLMKYFESRGETAFLDRCKFLHAVWFPSISNEYLAQLTLPSEADRRLILTKEALEDPTPYIESIYDLEIPGGKKTDVSVTDSQRIVRNILCPEFNVFPSASFNADLKKIVFHRLLREQAGILNFLDEQKTAVINGAAGTGKTMIAAEKALRHAVQGEKVLFLCYNVQLKEYLEQNYANENIEFYTIAGFACKMCGTSTPDFDKLKQKLDDMYLSERFPYKHVIIDEGQDFGMDDIEESDILQAIKDIITDNTELDGTFYIFYDKLQLIQAGRVPKYIEDADCKLTLYRNCRNTENIAITSLKPVSGREPKLFEGSVIGTPARFIFCEQNSEEVNVDECLAKMENDGFKDIVILSCKTEATSCLAQFVKDGVYKKRYRFSTCRKFKGLEADTVILVDVDGETFNADNVLLFYVGTSRARIKLDIVTSLDNETCKDILENKLNYQGKIKKPKRDLAKALKAIGEVN